MVKQPQESRYAKDSNRISEMKEVYEMFHIQHLRVTEIMPFLDMPLRSLCKDVLYLARPLANPLSAS